MNKDEEYFIRELTRKLDEQINSIRRELDNLKRMGFLKTRTKNRKKYYYINKDFIILDELKGIMIKALSSQDRIAKDIAHMGDVKILALSGQFIDKDTESVDMLIVGSLDKEKFAKYLSEELRTARPVKFTIMNEQDYRYRIDCKDKFINEIISAPGNQILINKFS